MKKIFTLLVAAISILTVSAEATKTHSYTGYLRMAIDDETQHSCVTLINPTSITYTILNSDASVMKTFTISGLSNPWEENLQIDALDDMRVAATRGIFTDDGKWCVIIGTEVNNVYKVQIYNEDGQIVGKLPRTDHVGYILLGNVTTGKPMYYTFDDEGSDYDVYSFWSFTGNSSVQAPTIVNQVPAYPNPLPQNATLIVPLTDEADAHTVLTINDINGRQVYRKTIPQGETEVRVSNRFAHGQYIYTVIYANGDVYSGKLLAE